jgi:hypothetical protein
MEVPLFKPKTVKSKGKGFALRDHAAPMVFALNVDALQANRIARTAEVCLVLRPWDSGLQQLGVV